MSWESDTGTPISSLEELSELFIGSVILSNHGRVWKRKFSEMNKRIYTQMVIEDLEALRGGGA